MEPVEPKVKYVIFSRVVSVEKKEKTVGGYKDETEQVLLIKEDMGWFILMEGSQEYLYIGEEEPTLKKGDRVKITIEGVP